MVLDGSVNQNLHIANTLILYDWSLIHPFTNTRFLHIMKSHHCCHFLHTVYLIPLQCLQFSFTFYWFKNGIICVHEIFVNYRRENKFSQNKSHLQKIFVYRLYPCRLHGLQNTGTQKSLEYWHSSMKSWMTLTVCTVCMYVHWCTPGVTYYRCIWMDPKWNVTRGQGRSRSTRMSLATTRSRAWCVGVSLYTSRKFLPSSRQWVSFGSRGIHPTIQSSVHYVRM